jgi:hypothetical protein
LLLELVLWVWVAVGWERLNVVLFGAIKWTDLPDLSRVVGGAGGEFADVWRQEDAGYVGGVGGEVCYWNQLGGLVVLYQLPDEDVPLRKKKLKLLDL